MKKIILLIGLLYYNQAYSQKPDSSRYNYTWDYLQDNIEHNKGKFPPPEYLLRYLNIIHIVDTFKTQPLFFSNFCKSVNINTEIKNRLILILKNEWTFDEIKYKWEKLMLKQQKILSSNISECFNRMYATKDIEVSSSSLYNYIYDSLSKPYKSLIENDIYSYKIPSFIVLAAAWIDLKEAKPILKKAYLEKSKNFDSHYLMIALAKLGDKDALNELFKLNYVYKIEDWQCSQYNLIDIIFPLKFVGSQESISQIHKLLDTTKKCSHFGTDDMTRDIYSATKVIKLFKNLFQNSSLKLATNNFNFDYYYWDRVITGDVIYKLKKWIIDNRGLYDLNKEQILFEKKSLQDQYFPKLW